MNTPPLAPSARSATVYLAVCKAYNEFVAVKALDLDAVSTPLEDIKREVAVMRQYRHPAILPLYCSFVAGHEVGWLLCVCGGGAGLVGGVRTVCGRE